MATNAMRLNKRLQTFVSQPVCGAQVCRTQNKEAETNDSIETCVVHPSIDSGMSITEAGGVETGALQYTSVGWPASIVNPIRVIRQGGFRCQRCL